ncbi:unnamed protein product [Pleuronectes platessa]|uniref:Uncharacterized protein n=1 Tax=Pleuronectes platessa TaxID=8262 RepID=A0A9N7TUT0_PLEPL|nr:unnamed protein product [Pleuronectes platessa]
MFQGMLRGFKHIKHIYRNTDIGNAMGSRAARREDEGGAARSSCLAQGESHAGAAEYSGSQSEKHTLCSAGPHQPRPEGTTLKDMENWGRELPSFPLQELRFTAGQPPLSLHQGEGTTLIRDGVPPTKPDHIDPCHHPGPLMEVLGIQTPPPLRHRRQVALYSSLEAAGRAALLFSPWDWLFGNIAGRCVQMSTF